MLLFRILFLSFLLQSCAQESGGIKPRIGSITESVYASVTLQPDSLYASYATVNGIVSELFVKEGDLVKENEAILQITNDLQELDVDNAKLALELIQKKNVGDGAILIGLKEDIQAAELNLQYDSINFVRQKKLWTQDIGTRNDFDRRKLAFQISQKKLKLLKNQYDRTKNELKTQLKQSENNYRSSQVLSKDHAVESRINGMVYQLFKEPGELVNQQEPVATIGSATSFIVELLVDEVDIAKIELGMKVFVTLDAYSGEVFKAKIHRIYPQKNERTQTFKVDALFDEQPLKLYPELSGEANIITNVRENALIIPRSYLIEGNKVQTKDGSLEVKTGIYSMEEIEIIEGLDSSTYIVKPN